MSTHLTQVAMLRMRMRSIGLSKIAVFYVLMSALAVAVMAHQRELGLRLIPIDLPTAVQFCIAGVAVGLLIVAASRLISLHTAWGARLADEFRILVGALNTGEAAWLALLSGVGEELFFRGALQPALGIWIASAIFAAMHVGPNIRFAPWTVITFVVGLVLGEMLQRTGSLWPPIIAHATVNFANLRYLSTELKPSLQFRVPR